MAWRPVASAFARWLAVRPALRAVERAAERVRRALALALVRRRVAAAFRALALRCAVLRLLLVERRPARAASPRGPSTPRDRAARGRSGATPACPRRGSALRSHHAPRPRRRTPCPPRTAAS